MKIAAHTRFDEVDKEARSPNQTSADLPISPSDEESEPGGSNALESARPSDAREGQLLETGPATAKAEETHKRKRRSDTSGAIVSAEKAEGLSKKERKRRKKMHQKENPA